MGRGLINEDGSLSERTPKNGSSPTSGPLRRMGRTAGGPGAPRKQRVFLPPLNLRGRRMATAFNTRKRIRRFFGHIESVAPMPNLIEVQKSSYEGFLQRTIPAAKRTQSGLQEVFRGVFPIKDFAERASLEFVKYEFEEPKYDVEECQQRGITYAAPLKVTLQLVVCDIKEQDVYMGDMPLMTDNGTFIVNGTERVIVSQMHRSPGVFFDHDKGKTHSSGK